MASYKRPGLAIMIWEWFSLCVGVIFDFGVVSVGLVGIVVLWLRLFWWGLLMLRLLDFVYCINIIIILNTLIITYKNIYMRGYIDRKRIYISICNYM